ncbi:zinc-binding dehydrogenase [Streptomyces malaysiensis]|uniref:zinc-binding dehydrogenase n=1 Tax=Streptomyces malaysiensis TaxID=92644 RepID=UPI00371E2959
MGDSVTDVAAGDRVVLSFNSCGRCTSRRTGRPTACGTYFPLNFQAARPDGTTPIRTPEGAPLGGLFFGQSSLARYAVVSAQSVVRVDGADDDEFALLVPVGCGIQTGAGAILNLLRPEHGDSVAVFGAGAVGLSAVMAARLTAARTIVSVDVVPWRLALATELGATHTVNSGTEDLGRCLADSAGPTGVTHVLETTGVSSLTELASTAIAANGTVAVIGAPTAGSRASFDISALIDGRTVCGVTEGGSDRITFIPALIDLAAPRTLAVREVRPLLRRGRAPPAVRDAKCGGLRTRLTCEHRSNAGRGARVTACGTPRSAAGRSPGSALLRRGPYAQFPPVSVAPL